MRGAYSIVTQVVKDAYFTVKYLTVPNANYYYNNNCDPGVINERRESSMSEGYDLPSNFSKGGYLTDLGKFSLGNAGLNLYKKEPESNLDVISVDSDEGPDPTDLPKRHAPIIPEITEDRSY